MTHLHSRIAKLAEAAIDRGEIISCDRISNATYLIKRSINGKPKTTKFTVVGAASLLYLLSAAANASESLDPSEPDSDFSSHYSEPEPPSEPDFFLDPEPDSDFDPEPDSDFDSEYLEPEPEPDLETETETETEFLEAI